MIVDIRNVLYGQGWSDYTLMQKGKKREGATLIMGNTVLGDKICRSLEYKSGNAVNGVVSFATEDSVSKEQARAIAKEFIAELMHGFRADEFHCDMVEHTDTNYLHYHFRIPKLNILTNTQLKIYWHKSDLRFKKAIINHLAKKYDLIIGTDKKKLMPDANIHIKQINKWRKEHGQEPFVLSEKKGKSEADERIADYMSECIMSGLVNSLDDTKAEIGELGFVVLDTDGYDRGKDFHYLTIENESGKMRIKGDIYSDEFYRHNQEHRSEAISTNRSIESGRRSDKRSGEESGDDLLQERKKRLRFINNQYGNARKRADERLYKRAEESKVEQHKNEKNTADVSSTNHPNTGDYNWNIISPNVHSNPYCNKREQDTSRQGQDRVLPDSRTTKHSEDKIDDRNRTETARRVRAIRARARARKNGRLSRTIRYREEIQRVDREVHRGIEQYSEWREGRTKRYSDMAENSFRRKRANFGVIRESTEKQGYKRGIREGFVTIIRAVTAGIRRFKSSFGSLHREIERSFDRRNEQLIRLVTGVAESRKIQDKVRKKKKIKIKILK